MANISLKFPHRTLRLFLVAVVIIIGTIVLLDFGGSVFLNNYLRSLQRDLSQKEGFRLEFRSAFFEIFTGIRINDLKLRQGGRDIFSARTIGCSFDLLKFIFEKRLCYKKLFAWQPSFYS